LEKPREKSGRVKKKRVARRTTVSCAMLENHKCKHGKKKGKGSTTEKGPIGTKKKLKDGSPHGGEIWKTGKNPLGGGLER